MCPNRCLLPIIMCLARKCIQKIQGEGKSTHQPERHRQSVNIPFLKESAGFALGILDGVQVGARRYSIWVTCRILLYQGLP